MCGGKAIVNSSQVPKLLRTKLLSTKKGSEFAAIKINRWRIFICRWGGADEPQLKRKQKRVTI
jgi:hypothetical protein